MNRVRSPKVTVIIPTCNRAHLVGRAIQSVLHQTYEDFELSVVDDASPDNTEEVVASFDDPRIRYIRHKHNEGAPAARNTGVGISRGEYIAFLDDDDTWHFEKLERQLAVFESAPCEVGVVCCHISRCPPGASVQICEARGEVSEQALRFNMPGCNASSMLIRACALQGIYPLDESLPGCQDTDMMIQLSQRWHFDFADAVLVSLGRGSEGISASRGKIVGREMVLKKHGELYDAYPPATRRYAFAKHLYEVSRWHARQGDRAGAFASLLRSSMLSPKLALQMLLLYARHRVRARGRSICRAGRYSVEGFPGSASDAGQQ